MNANETIFFYKEGEEYGFLSNWYPTVFYAEGLRFTSTEQYLMYQKAKLFGDTDMAEKIMASSDQGEIKHYGRLVRGFDGVIWNGFRPIIMYKGLMHKFTQSPLLREELLATGDAVLAECTERDVNFATGLNIHDAARFDRNNWKGQNILGFALMAVREELRASNA